MVDASREAQQILGGLERSPVPGGIMEGFTEEIPFELSFKRWLDVNCISIKLGKNKLKDSWEIKKIVFKITH